jgi:D-threo-aldose 1-dehydrogenase
VIGAPYASGILVRGPLPDALYDYRPATPEVLARAQRIFDVCRRHDVPLATAALQFPFGHPSVAAVIPGPVAPEEVRSNLAWMRRDVPQALWAELGSEGLVRQDAPAPRPRAPA